MFEFNRSILVLILISVSVITVIPLSPSKAASISTTKSVSPPTFGIDAGLAKWSFSATKFSWVSGLSNTTLTIPSLSVSVSGTLCAIIQTSIFSHNSTTYNWALTGVQTCNLVVLTTTMNVYVKNVTNVYYEKEIVVSGVTTKIGLSSIVNQVSFALSSNQQGVQCSGCSYVTFGNTVFDWSVLSGDTSSFSSSIFSVSSAASTGLSTSYTFDPLALDGSGKCAMSAGVSTCNISLTTASSPDVIIVGCGVNLSGVGLRHCTAPTATGLTFTFRTSEIDSTTNNMTEWYAIASSTFSGNIACNESLVGLGGCTGFGISGANTGSPFDANAAIPAKAAGSNSKPSVATVSTSNANDMLIGLTEDAGTTQQTGGTCAASTCTLITTGSAAPVVASEYLVVSSTQSSATVAFGTSTGVGNTWALIADAINLSVVSYTKTISTTVSAVPVVPKSSIDYAKHTLSITPLVPRTAIHLATVLVTVTPVVSAMKVIIRALSLAISASPLVSLGIKHLVSVVVSASPAVSGMSVIIRYVKASVTATIILLCGVTGNHCGNSGGGSSPVASQNWWLLGVALMLFIVGWLVMKPMGRKY